MIPNGVVIRCARRFRVVPARVERATLALGKPCSIQLSYGTLWNRYMCVLAWVRCDWQVWLCFKRTKAGVWCGSNANCGRIPEEAPGLGR